MKNDTVTSGSMQCIVVLLRRHLISCVHIFSFLFFLLVFVIIIIHRYPDLAILSFLFWFCSVRWKRRSAECGVRSAECGVRSAENEDCGNTGKKCSKASFSPSMDV